MFLHLLGGDQLTAIFSRNNASGAEVVSKFVFFFLFFFFSFFCEFLSSK